METTKLWTPSWDNMLLMRSDGKMTQKRNSIKAEIREDWPLLFTPSLRQLYFRDTSIKENIFLTILDSISGRGHTSWLWKHSCKLRICRFLCSDNDTVSHTIRRAGKTDFFSLCNHHRKTSMKTIYSIWLSSVKNQPKLMQVNICCPWRLGSMNLSLGQWSYFPSTHFLTFMRAPRAFQYATAWIHPPNIVAPSEWQDSHSSCASNSSSDLMWVLLSCFHLHLSVNTE